MLLDIRFMKVKLIVVFVMGLLFGFLFRGTPLSLMQEPAIKDTTVQEVTVLKDTKVYLDGEMQTSRTKDGKRMYPLKYEDSLYIPLTEIGYAFKDKKVEVKENLIDIKTVEVVTKLENMDSETLEGEPFTFQNVTSSEYTVFLKWATWCPYCLEALAKAEAFSQRMKDNGVQVVGILLDSDLEEAKNHVKEKGVTFKNVISNDYIKDALQTNIESIPEYVLVNKEGKDITDKSNNSLNSYNLAMLEQQINELLKSK